MECLHSNTIVGLSGDITTNSAIRLTGEAIAAKTLTGIKGDINSVRAEEFSRILYI